MAVIGAFTEGTARLRKRGAFKYSDAGIIESSTDLYELLMASGVTPTADNVTGLPARGADHPDTSELYVRKYEFIPEGGDLSNHWRVNVHYTRYSSEALYPGSTDDLVEKSWDVVETTSDLICDASTGIAIVNAAGDPFDSVPQKTDVAPKVTFTRIEASAPTAKYALNGTINSDSITVLGITFDAHCARIKITFNNTGPVEKPYKVTYEIEGRTNYVNIEEEKVNIGWDIAFLECGFNYKDDAGNLRPFIDVDENGKETKASMPRNLLSDGTPADGATPVVRIVQQFEEDSWSSLNLISAIPALPSDE